jgi:hypothetical protein
MQVVVASGSQRGVTDDAESGIDSVRIYSFSFSRRRKIAQTQSPQ